MPYATQRDREPHLLELEQTPWPAPPLNLFLTGYQRGVYDLAWTSPGDLALNSRFLLCGVNIYRSFDSEFGPYDRINEYPIGTGFWRDQTDNVLEIDEVVTDDKWVARGDRSAGELDSPRFVFRTERYPIVKEGSQNIPADSILDVEVRIDGQVARLRRVTGTMGEVEIDPNPYPNVATQKRDPGTVPFEGSVVTVTYRYNRSFLRTDLDQRVFYRVTSVGTMVTDNCGQPGNPLELLETPLERAAFTSNFQIEKIDYMWNEAVRRNQWILNQGGERCKLFIRKQVGPQCGCFQRSTHNQPLGDCRFCYGTGILGGYEGPYDIIIAPDDAERKISQRDVGRTMEHSYEAFSGPSPLLSQRDFVVKINGERYSVGAVRRPTNRGMVLQQHFMIGHLDEKDIRYRVPIDNPSRFLANQVAPAIPSHNQPAQITDRPGIPDEREIRGRNIVWENIVYAIPFFFLLRSLIDAVSWSL